RAEGEFARKSPRDAFQLPGGRWVSNAIYRQGPAVGAAGGDRHASAVGLVVRGTTLVNQTSGRGTAPRRMPNSPARRTRVGRGFEEGHQRDRGIADLETRAASAPTIAAGNPGGAHSRPRLYFV